MAKFWMLLFLASVSFGKDIFSVGIRTSFRYEDLEKQCYLPPMANHFVLAAEVESGAIQSAKLKKTMLDGYSQVLDLTESEIRDIQPQEIKGRLWLKSWKVTERVLSMLLYGGTDQGFDTCYPPSGIETIEPASFTFEFNSGSNEKMYSDSNEALFGGTTKKGAPYRIELFLVQDRV